VCCVFLKWKKWPRARKRATRSGIKIHHAGEGVKRAGARRENESESNAEKRKRKRLKNGPQTRTPNLKKAEICDVFIIENVKDVRLLIGGWRLIRH